MQRLLIILLVALAALLTLMPVAAQDELTNGSPLLELLRFVPANAPDLGPILFSYADYAAIEAARPGLPEIESSADFLSNDEAARAWLNNSFRINAGASNLFRYFMVMVEEGPELLGFDVFDIDRSLEVGQPPATLTILSGALNPVTVNLAYGFLGFETTEIGGLPALCSADGCDVGMEHDLRGREPANPFGGDLGRRQPILVLPEALVSSPSEEFVEGAAAAYQGEVESMADDLVIQAAVEAITPSDGALLQAIFLDPAGVMTLSPLPNGEPLDEFVADYGSLPPYKLAILADTQEGQDQVARVALVYADEESATEAAAELSERLRNFSPPSIGDTDLLILEDRGGTVEDGTVYSSADGTVFVAVVPVRSATPPLPEPDEANPMTPGIVFRTLVQALYRRELLPLVVVE